MKSNKTKAVIRTCVCCGKKEDKGKLNRFVWNQTEPVLDEEKIKNGRGAYCCIDDKCTQQFVKQHKKWTRFFRLYK